MLSHISGSGSIKLIHQNIQGLTSKIHQVEILADLYCPDIICLSEHFLTVGDFEALTLAGFSVATGFCRSKMRRGGTCILVRDRILFSVVDVSKFCVEGCCEMSAVKLEARTSTYLILTIYRPPTTNSARLDLFAETLRRCLDTYLKRDVLVIVTGDFNIDLSCKTQSSDLLSGIMASFGLRDTIFSFTREYNGSSSLIDNIFTNIPHDNFLSSVLITGISDHHAQVCDFYSDIPIVAKPLFKVSRLFTSENIKLFSNTLQLETWDNIFRSSSLDEKFQNFLSTLAYHFDLIFPEKKVRLKETKMSGKVPLNPTLLSMRERLTFMYLLTRDLNSANPLKKEYIVLKNKFKKEVLSFKASLIQKRIEKSQNLQKAMWSVVNQDRPGNSAKSFNKILIENDENETLDDPIKVANYLNTFFTDVALRLGRDQSSPVATTASLKPISATFALFPTDEREVISVISSLKTSSSSGRDSMSSKLLKACSVSLASPLSHLINESFTSGIFPSILKLGIVKPLQKNKNSKKPEDFRPITILSTYSKVFEKVFLNRLMSFLNSNNIIFSKQFGFQKNISTLNALFDFTTYVSSSLENHLHTLGIFLDLSKAFDVINHSLLLSKLECLGFRGLSFDWISSFLMCREQVVEVPYIDSSGCMRVCESNVSLIKTGVPQGSILGPILFLLFINDISTSVSPAGLCLFADDTSIAISNKSVEQLEIEAFIKGNSLVQWMCNNGLFVNTDKSKLIKFTKSGGMSPEINHLLLNESGVESCASLSFLGVVIDCDLNFQQHVRKVSNKLNSCLFLLRRLSLYSNKKILLLAYHGCFVPHLTYCLPIWGSENCRTKKLFVLQKRAIRIVLGMHNMSSCRGIFRSNRLLTFPCMFIFESLVFLMKNLNLFPLPPTNSHNLRSKQSLSLAIPAHSSTHFEKQTFYSSIKLFNKLPATLKTEHNLAKFKKVLRAFLVEKEYYSLNDYFNDEI